ncbi:MAG: hypothetical protein A3G33_05785 [Omnitrophica bacterium RIFCSPLOWO2_12_FULL_44_17]|uniref:Type 4 fimbrial biogenesis protein PilX N-terminal domain-containing protein n=1 Tax=Candidatus Danuiimicrobium aquiferis TaxID=1801832 RepID=A0A1G1L375_9BACT|nr:MAG: hypothetical protein A3B72_08280 [Omnitrophica bacterium RIFCSPHIGHO2_02_FULL_45_28]OGW99582.1 MAG: hypothetical protein A3G33_05785 [Omnitrophica bacterium RIFCSPLOWO2_12_FULL_44_17]OGX03617.1 MAG: hypothetical protein A3J12_05540 [Omnitrophica bacterium RIFCSPLOWO2_02_FULL_44_11]
MKKLAKNKKGILLIWFYLLITVIIIVSGSVYALSFQENRLTNMELAQNQAFYLAETGIDKMLIQLRTTGALTSLSGSLGRGTYSSIYDSGTKMVTSTGTVSGSTKTVRVKVVKSPPVGVRGALTSYGNVSLNGNIIVDGRDYDSNGDLTGDPGSYGVSAGGSVDQGGSSIIGGNGHEPSDPANSDAYEEFATMSQFTTPEEVLGMAPGSLDIYKTATPPATPFTNQIVYLTGNWQAPDFGTEDAPSTGILIVHNSSNDAYLKNVHGWFKGIIIADDLIHINGDANIIGAAVLQKTTGNAVGNGAAHVNFSSEVLGNLPIANYAVVAWEDAQNQ